MTSGSSRWRPVPIQPDHPCFACGHANPIGLRMEFETDGERLRSRLELPAQMCGWRGVAHGGIVSTVLDEVMGNAAVVLLERLVLTQRMEVEYFKPVPLEVGLVSAAWVEERTDERHATLAADIRDESGQHLAAGRATYALFTPEAARKVGLDGKLVEDFETFMGQCSGGLEDT